MLPRLPVCAIQLTAVPDQQGGDQPRPEMTFLDFGSETRRHKGGDFGATTMVCFDGPQDEFEIGR
jgi:hypothetical protein